MTTSGVLVLYWESFQLCWYISSCYCYIWCSIFLLLSRMKSSGRFQLRINSETKLFRKVVGPQMPPGLCNLYSLADSSVVRQPSFAAGFLCFYMTLTVPRSYSVDGGDNWLIMNWTRFGRRDSDIYLDVLRKNMKSFSQDSQCSNWDSNVPKTSLECYFCINPLANCRCFITPSEVVTSSWMLFTYRCKPSQ